MTATSPAAQIRISRNISEKANRLRKEGRVHPLNGDRSLYLVEGDSAPYLVALLPDDALAQALGEHYTGRQPNRHVCPCEHGRQQPHELCAHATAAVRDRRDWLLDGERRDAFHGVNGEAVPDPEPSRYVHAPDAIDAREVILDRDTHTVIAHVAPGWGGIVADAMSQAAPDAAPDDAGF